ncbi:hypothetical protein DL769_001897 [Monosporascus sp. CRB-8-3]|nr:hypothetical protein DL769_001897 [Monosporascus sp. CRB-8-3]
MPSWSQWPTRRDTAASTSLSATSVRTEFVASSAYVPANGASVSPLLTASMVGSSAVTICENSSYTTPDMT